MQKSYNRYFFLFVLPTLLAFAVMFVLPFCMGLFLSFTKFTTVNNWEWVGFANYIDAFRFDSGFGSALLFTVKFTAVSVVSVNVFAFLLALALTRSLRGSDVFRTVFFMPNLIGGIVLGYIWNLIINGILGFYGLDITYDASYGFWGLVALMNWQLIGYMMVIYIAGLQNVPSELLEAAAIDGASPFQRLRYILLPVLSPSIAICTFLTLTNSFKLFDQNLALTAGAPANETSMLALDIYQTFYGRIGWQGVGQAKAVLFFLIVALISFAQLKLTSGKEA
ncbi:MAG: sugar ABC transporter permease [Clostridia bacterium]|nr:sugar ABC transporter permease [Clostridia bacterium]